jgi:predicted ATP-binding protein involved in virulence
MLAINKGGKRYAREEEEIFARSKNAYPEKALYQTHSPWALEAEKSGRIKLVHGDKAQKTLRNKLNQLGYVVTE